MYSYGSRYNVVGAVIGYIISLVILWISENKKLTLSFVEYVVVSWPSHWIGDDSPGNLLETPRHQQFASISNEF